MTRFALLAAVLLLAACDKPNTVQRPIYDVKCWSNGRVIFQGRIFRDWFDDYRDFDTRLVVVLPLHRCVFLDTGRRLTISSAGE